MCEVGSNLVSDYVHLFAGIFFGGVVSYVVMLNLNYNIQQDLKNHNDYEVKYTVNNDRFNIYCNTNSEDEISEDEIHEYDSEDDDNTSKNVVDKNTEESIEDSAEESAEESVEETRETTSEENQLKLE